MQGSSHLFQTTGRAARDDTRAEAVEIWLKRGLRAQSDHCFGEPLPLQWLDMIDRNQRVTSEVVGIKR